ncbi:MAG TPA: HAD family hydrolase [Pyrinomonadaceae bacterium]|nr:HAD family hydrolase [Pyrinomonadaceae bacterium]
MERNKIDVGGAADAARSEPAGIGAVEEWPSRNAARLHPALRGVRAVLFDVGGTLLHPEWSRLSQLAVETTGRFFGEDELRRAMNEMLRGVSAEIEEKGKSAVEERRRHWVFHRMYAALGLDEETCISLRAKVDAAHDERHMWCGLDPEAPPVLATLKDAGFRVAAISNTEDGRLEELLQLARIADQFDFYLDSHVVGHRKPDAAIFHLALARLGLEPHEVAFVGDSYAHDALAARAVGMRAILLDALDLHPESVCPRIRALGELVSLES